METAGCSIIVPTYNQAGYLRRCLDSLFCLLFPIFEIIVVDDGSTDGTKDYLASLKEPRLKICWHSHNRGASQARNSGIELADYDFLAFIDSDCSAEKKWLNYLLEGFSNENIGFVFGRTVYREIGYRGYFPERLIQNKGAWPGGGNIIYRRKIFHLCGGFDPYFFYYHNEDSEMAIRAVSRGFNFRPISQAIVYHQPAEWTPPSLLASARNASVWPILKKRYPKFYLTFNPPIAGGIVVESKDYLYLLFLPILIPILLVRYLIHGQRDLKIFFTKWPIYFFLRRYYIYKEATRNKVLVL